MVGFESWLAAIGLLQGVPSERAERLQPWLRSVYDEQGPLSLKDLRAAWTLDALAATERAVSLVLADVHRTTLWLPEVIVSDFMEGAVAITIEGHAVVPAGGADPTDEARLVCDVAECVCEELVHDMAKCGRCALHI